MHYWVDKDVQKYHMMKGILSHLYDNLAAHVLFPESFTQLTNHDGPNLHVYW